MTILEVCSYLYPALAYGGPAKVVYDFSLELSKNHQVVVYTSDVYNQERRIKDSEKIKAKKNFAVKYFKNLVNSWAYRWRFFSNWGMVGAYLLERKKYDLVHIHDVFILPQIVLAYLALIGQKPIIISPHGVLNPIRQQRRSLIKRLFFVLVKPILRRATLVATSPQEAQELKSLGFKGVKVVANAVPQFKVKPSCEFGDLVKKDKTTLLYIGKLHPQKGLLELLEAYQKMAADYQLFIAGQDDGIEKKLKAHIEQRQLENAHFLGYVNDSQKAELFSLADLFVYPSYAEGFSIAILEAMQVGLPVLITTGCNFPAVKAEKAGWVVKTKDLRQNLATVLHSIKEPALVQRGLNAKKLVGQKYSIERMAQEMEQIYAQSV